MLSFVTFAQEVAEEESSHVAFYVLGLTLVIWALAVSAMGISRSQRFPGGKTGRRGVIGLTLALVVATCATAVITA